MTANNFVQALYIVLQHAEFTTTRLSCIVQIDKLLGRELFLEIFYKKKKKQNS